MDETTVAEDDRQHSAPTPTSIPTSTPASTVGVLETESLDGELLEDELLVEEISIDGMCGVY